MSHLPPVLPPLQLLLVSPRSLILAVAGGAALYSAFGRLSG